MDAPLPLEAYLVGAAIAVGLSFAFVAISDGRRRSRAAPWAAAHAAPLARLGLRAVGLAAWTWVVLQAIAGGDSDAEVASLILWVFGWVGLALVSALLGPAWSWLDPFSTLHDLGSWLGRRLGLRAPSAPRAPAGASGMAAARWRPGRPSASWSASSGSSWWRRVGGGRPLGLVLIGYSARDAGRHGLVRARPLAQPRRGLQRLVRAARAAGAVRAGRVPPRTVGCGAEASGARWP